MILRNAFYKDLPNEQKRFDFGARTDGQPVYRGFARLGVPTSNSSWILVFSKYAVDGYLIEEYSLEGAWDDRVVLFVDYV